MELKEKERIYHSFLKNPFKQKLLKYSVKLGEEGVKNFARKYSKIANLQGYNYYKILRSERNLCFLWEVVINYLKYSNFRDIEQKKKKLSEELNQYDKKDIERDPELKKARKEFFEYSELIDEINKINRNLLSRKKDLLESINLEAFAGTGRHGKNYFFYMDTENYDYAFLKFEKNEHQEVYITLYCTNEQILNLLKEWVNLFFEVYNEGYVKANCIEDIRSIYIYCFYNHIITKTDIVRYGQFVKSIKCSMEYYLNENQSTLISNNGFRECIYHLGISLEELLERVYISLFDEPAPDISINDLIASIHRKCKQNIRDPNILINKFIKKKFGEKDNISISDYDYESDFINIEKLILRNGAIFGSHLDNMLVRARDIRNNAFHKNRKPIDRFEVLDMAVGVGMLFFWWKGIFEEHFSFPKQTSANLKLIDKKDINTSKESLNQKEVKDGR